MEKELHYICDKGFCPEYFIKDKNIGLKDLLLRKLYCSYLYKGELSYTGKYNKGVSRYTMPDRNYVQFLNIIGDFLYNCALNKDDEYKKIPEYVLSLDDEAIIEFLARSIFTEREDYVRIHLVTQAKIDLEKVEEVIYKAKEYGKKEEKKESGFSL